MKYDILAIDDEPDLLQLMERIIKSKTPYSIITTNNSLEVEHLLDNNVFELVITDLKMPGLDGLDILKMIKDKGRNEQVIIITAFGTLETAVEALSQGVFDYITKPFRKEQIIVTIEHAMKYQLMNRQWLEFKDILDSESFEQACDKLKKIWKSH
jgi:DNA-binding NtrC family response regulator